MIRGELGSEGVVVILTTNHLERVDETLYRSQRVDRKIWFPAEITKEAVVKS